MSVKIGDIIYIGDAFYIDRAEDDQAGGKAQVIDIEDGISGGLPTIYIRVAESPGVVYNWKFLEEQQEELKEQFGENWAHPLDKARAKKVGDWHTLSYQPMLRKKTDTPEGKAFWALAEKASKEVSTWPEWKQGKTPSDSISNLQERLEIACQTINSLIAMLTHGVAYAASEDTHTFAADMLQRILISTHDVYTPPDRFQHRWEEILWRSYLRGDLKLNGKSVIETARKLKEKK